MALALADTPTHGFASTTTTVHAVYTATAGAIVVACCFCEQTVQRTFSGGVSGAGLTWTKFTEYDAAGGGGGFVALAVFWAYAPSGFTSQTITATASGTFDDANIMLFSVTGVQASAQSNPFDPNASNPATAQVPISTSPTVNLSTTHANTFIVGFSGTNASEGFTNPGSGFTAIDNANNPGGGAFAVTRLEYVVESSPQTNLAVKYGGTSTSIASMMAFALTDVQTASHAQYNPFMICMD
jgi:hypothetical protein